MALTKSDKQELDQLYSDWSDKYGGCKEDYFACLYLAKKHRCSVPDIAHQVAFGGNDYGLDAYFIDRDARNLYLYQFKWSENHNLFKDSMDRLAKDGMARIFGNPMADPLANPLLNTLRAELHEHKAVIDRVYIHFVFKGDREAADNSQGLQNRLENLQNRSHLVQDYFANPNVELKIEFISDFRPPLTPVPQESHAVAFTDSVCVCTADGQKVMYVGFLPLMDLHRIHKSLGQRFFDRNIRFGLQPDNMPSSKIREALADIVLKQRLSPEVFCFNHNGVSLAAEKLLLENGQAVLKVPRLLNGAQTITSVAKFLLDNEGHPALESNAAGLAAIRVLAKIVVDDPSSDFVMNVTICNNRQNPVEPWNLRANDRIQCDLHDRLREEVQIFYSRQENAFHNYLYEDLEERGYQTAKDMRIRPLAQTFLAVQGEIKKMSELPDVFENQRWYEETFRDSYLQCDARKIVIAYKVHLVLRDPIQRIVERSPMKIGPAISKARNLVWALLIQGILNDPRLPTLLEDFGVTLIRETAFREYLKNLAGTRLVPILREVLGW